MMPGAFRSAAGSGDVSKPPPPPVAPRVTVQSWQSSGAPVATVAPLDEALNMYGNHVRSGSVDSLDSNSGSSVSSGSSGGSHTRQHSGDSTEFIPTRTLSKNPSVPAYNPLQFVKVQSPLYRKAEQQIKLVKEVKISRGTLKEGEEEWQSNLDNWKSRRRKVSEHVIQRAEEMRQIEAEEQNRQHQQQQRKIKTFSEIVEKRSQKKHNYNFDLYMGPGDDSGLGATPEPEDQDSSLDNLNSTARSDISEDVTSESDSIDSDARCSDKMSEKAPPEVPKKPHSRLFRKAQCTETFNMNSSSEDLLHHALRHKERFHSDNPSSAEPSDIEGHAGDIETLSSEDDVGYCGPIGNVDSGLESLSDSHRACCDAVDSSSDFSQDSCSGLDKVNRDADLEGVVDDEMDLQHDRKGAKIEYSSGSPKAAGIEISLRLLLKQNVDSKGFGFSLKGGKDQRCAAHVDSVSLGGAADAAGLLVGDEILSINGEKTCSNSHSSLVFAVKQAVYIGQLDLVTWRPAGNGDQKNEKEEKLLNKDEKTSTKKVSSFADKIAMFSNGVTSKVPHSPPAPPPPLVPRTSVPLSKVPKSDEPIKESLVLRRKSAFECSSTGEVKKRWSSCVTNENSAPVKVINGERRHSIDLTKPADGVCQSNSVSKKAPPPPVPDGVSQSNSVSKKAPPPPVPVKPKLKPRLQNTKSRALSNDDLSRNVVDVQHDTVNGKCENNLEDPNYSKPDPVAVPNNTEKSDITTDTLPNSPIRLQSNSANVSASKDIPVLNEVVNIINNESCSVIEQDFAAEVLENDLCDIPKLPDPPCDNQYFEISQNLVEPREMASPEVLVLSENDSTLLLEFEKIPPPPVFESDSQGIQIVSPEDIKSVCDLSESEPYQIKYEEECIPYTHTVCLSNIEEEVFYPVKEQENASIDSVMSIENQESVNNSTDSSCNLTKEFEGNLESDFVVDHETNCEDYHVEINVPPLCLTLERIDEDDGVSASTTTSSATPDTETIIEHFPSNVSPLPNDDLVNENFISDPRDSSSDQAPHSVIVSMVETSIPELVCDTNDQPAVTSVCENETMAKPEHQSTFLDVESNSHFRETFSRSQDDDVPLSEDVIDEIEMRLMQQLEQQGDFEDMGEDQDGQLEDEVNRQLLYLSDDADLLEDFDSAPRHAVPPSEPPPPPPPEEMEEADENLTPPLMRVNSTKRIKKEISRRRSDFLGLGSGETIDIDNIPPRPPGLEELYKSEMEIERGQRLWLEKRLSLVEPMPNETVCFDAPSSDIRNSDYSYYSNNMPEVLDAEVYDAVANDDYTGGEKQRIKEVYSAEEDSFLSESSLDETERVSLENSANTESTSPGESPQHKVKQHIQSLGAAPRAKIMDSDKWITQTEKAPAIKRRSMDPVLQESRNTQNFWLTQEAEKRNPVERVDSQPPPEPQPPIPPHNVVDRRYSMPPAYGTRQHPDVTVRTWGDREGSYQQRPKSAIWDASSQSARYDPYLESCYAGYPGASRVTPSHNQYESQAYSQRHPVDLRRCSYCREELADGSAMGIEALQLYFHIQCFHCCVCGVQLGNGSRGTDVQVKNNQLYCPSCFTLD